jgi:hypothetical protein
MPKKRPFLAGTIVALIATLITLALGEGVVRLVASQRLIYNIEMVKYARQLKQRDSRDLVRHVHRPSCSAKLMGVEVALNSLGNRGPELIDPKPAGVQRVMVLGSSITMGWGVPFESVFTSVAQRRLNGEKPFRTPVSFEFVNAGIGNYNTVFQRELFRDQYPRVRPDAVVLNYFISDVQPRTMGRDNPILKHSYLAAWAFDRYGQWQFARQGKGLFTYYSDLYADDSEPWRITREKIREMRDVCAASHTPFMVMIIPDIHDLSPGTPYRAIYERIELSFRGAGFEVVSTFPAFQQAFGADVTKLWIQGDDPHPNAAGHAILADQLVDCLVRPNSLQLPR